MPQRHEEALLAIFGILDEADNGVIDFSELLDLGKGVSASFNATKCRAVLGWMGEGHDGSVSKDEFVAFFGKVMEDYKITRITHKPCRPWITKVELVAFLVKVM